MAIKPPPAALHALAQLIRTPTALAFKRAAADPRAHQEARLLEMLAANASTEFGQQHDFSRIRSFQDYRARVPFMSPDDLKVWVDRLKAGERNLITAEPPIFYARSTGTSGIPKEVPITKTYRADFQRSMLAGMWFSYWATPKAFRGKLLYFVSRRCMTRAPDGVEVGFISGYNFTEMPKLVANIYAWPYEIFLIDHLPTRYYLMLQLATLQKMTLIAGIFPLGVVTLLRELEARAEELAHNLREGTFPDWLELDDSQRAFFSPWRRREPEVAARLEEASRRPRGELVPTAWPHLDAVFCWVTSTAGLYLPEMRELLGPDVTIRDTIYSASEGWCSIPMGEAEPGGALAITSHVYEFIEESVYEEVEGDITRLDPERTLLVDELTDGERYYIVLSTTSGLYRYCLGDLVEVCGMWRQIPRIKFVRKFGAYSSMTGEKLREPHVNASVDAALEKISRRASWFSLLPRPGAEAHYELFIEFAGEPLDAGALGAFASDVDKGIAAEAYEYNTNRQANMLGPVRLMHVRQGFYQRYCQELTSQGGSVGQLKMSHLVQEEERLPAGARDAVEQVFVSSWRPGQPEGSE